MLKNGYLTEGDIRGKHYYSTASGEIREGTIICLREVKIGDAVLRNIEASVTHTRHLHLRHSLNSIVHRILSHLFIDNITLILLDK